MLLDFAKTNKLYGPLRKATSRWLQVAALPGRRCLPGDQARRLKMVLPSLMVSITLTSLIFIASTF
jgi:hypothetical protein